MRRVSLLSVEMMGFKCFHEHTRLKLSTAAGFKSLTGDNQQEPGLGANGAGKSSFLDAIFFCLYGTGLKGQKAAALTTWHADIRPWVKTVWRLREPGSLAPQAAVIERSGSPDKLTINGQPASQEDVDRLVGLSKMRFRHAVIFGQNVEFFAQLSIAERSALMEEVCDLSLWQRAADEADLAAKAAQREADDHAREILRFETRLDMLPSLKALRRMQADWAARHSAALEEAEAAYGAARAELRAMAPAAEPSSGGVAKWTNECRVLSEFADTLRAQWAEEEKALKDAAHALKHLAKKPNCPNCGQRWPDLYMRKKELEAEVGKRTPEERRLLALVLRADEAARAAGAKLEEAEEAFREAEKQVARNAGAYDAQKRLAASLKARRDEVLAETDEAIAARIEDTGNKRAHYQDQIIQRTGAKAAAEGELGIATYWKSAFRQVRLFQMKRVLQHLELEIEAAMNSLGLRGWKIKLSTETETKSGTFKQGVQIQVESPKASAPWESWSGGESQRLTLAIAIGFANMIKRMSGVSYSFEFWDEPSAWLSVEGIEDMIATLRNRAEQERISLWLVDHRSMGAAFDETWIVRKGEEGAHIERL